MSKILEKLGLTPEEVRASFGLDEPEPEYSGKNYLFRRDQHRMRHRMKFWDGLVYARYMSGMHPSIIAGCLGVSEETVRVRLRKSGFFAKT
jgi:hypothetical protein